MRERTDALMMWSELLICLCKKELYFGKIEELQKRSAEKKDVFSCMKGNFFLKLKMDYQENLVRAEEEFLEAEKELLEAEKELIALDEKISGLRGSNIERTLISEEMSDEEEELHTWCYLAEKFWEMFSLLHSCIENGTAEQLRVISHAADMKKNAELHDDIDTFFAKLDDALSMVGKVRYLAGLRVKNGFRTNRSELLGGKTLMFLRNGYPPFKLDIRDCYLREMESGWATGLALDAKLKELKVLELLCRGIVQEQVLRGEVLLKNVKMRSYFTAEKDIFGFDREG